MEENWFWPIPYINIDLIIQKIQPMLNLKLLTDNKVYETVVKLANIFSEQFLWCLWL